MIPPYFVPSSRKKPHQVRDFHPIPCTLTGATGSAYSHFCFQLAAPGDFQQSILYRLPSTRLAVTEIKCLLVRSSHFVKCLYTIFYYYNLDKHKCQYLIIKKIKNFFYNLSSRDITLYNDCQ